MSKRKKQYLRNKLNGKLNAREICSKEFLTEILCLWNILYSSENVYTWILDYPMNQFLFNV